MTAHVCRPLGRSELRQSPALGLALAVLLASTLAACGRSGLIRLGEAELDAAPNGQTGGAAGGKTDGGAAGGSAGDASATDKPPATDAGPSAARFRSRSPWRRRCSLCPWGAKGLSRRR